MAAALLTIIAQPLTTGGRHVHQEPFDLDIESMPTVAAINAQLQAVGAEAIPEWMWDILTGGGHLELRINLPHGIPWIQRPAPATPRVRDARGRFAAAVRG